MKESNPAHQVKLDNSAFKVDIKIPKNAPGIWRIWGNLRI